MTDTAQGPEDWINQLIAEELEPDEPRAIFYDAEGLVQGTNFDRRTVALLTLAQSQASRLLDIESRLKVLEDR